MRAFKRGVVVMNQRNKLSSGRMKRLVICIGLILALMSMVIPFGFAQAQNGRVKPEMAFPDHYPYNGFHGMGTILTISENDAVIDDKVFAFSSDVAYHTQEIENASSAFFRAGQRVGYILDLEGNIKSLWLLE